MISPLQTRHEIGNRNPKRVGNPLDVSKRNVSFPAFDSADVSAVEITTVGERLLREAHFLA